MNRSLVQVPSKEDWGDVDGDFDAEDAFRNFYGRNNADTQKFFSNNVLMRAQDIRFMPRLPFAYYIGGFSDYVRAHPKTDCTHVADAFIGVVEERLSSDPQAVKLAAETILSGLNYIVENAQGFEDETDVYGDLQKKAACVQRAVERLA
jgi:hypothetical protein